MEIITILDRIQKEQIDLYEHTLPALEQEIFYLFSKINDCSDFKYAESYFDLLELIHDALGLLVYKYDVTVSRRLNKFLRDCERIDDDITRKWLFNEIKHNKYSL